MAKVKCKCGESVVNFKHLKAEDLKDFEADCCPKNLALKLARDLDASPSDEPSEIEPEESDDGQMEEESEELPVEDDSEEEPESSPDEAPAAPRQRRGPKPKKSVQE